LNELKTILLVEDDPNDVKLTMKALEEYALANNVSIVNDGEEALDFLYYRGKFEDRENGTPIVILLDLKLPKINGLEVLRMIKSDKNLKNIPIVILTSSREESDLDECYELGVNAYVVKPVDFHDFIESIRRLGIFWILTNEPPRGSKNNRNT
jgi:CheY-like chemotaxis protein